jgi:hypothetical protein
LGKERKTMNAYRLSIVAGLPVLVSMAVMIGCEYDVAEPQWDKPLTTTTSPRISAIDPAQEAKAGVNTITIRGENFAAPPDSNEAYFDNQRAEIVSTSSTSITVRRPNLVDDSVFIKVVSNKALVVAKFGPYKIYPVFQRNGAFRDNIVLNALAVDNGDNLYVVYGDSSTPRIFKVTPDEQRILVARASRLPTEGRFGPDGRLYLLGNNRSIDVVDVQAGTAAQWLRLPSGRIVRVGDFDANGYFYVGGTRSDLVVIAPNLSVSPTGIYASDDIVAVRVYSGYLFVASRVPTSGGGPPAPASIWKHQIDASGNVGAKELVLDMSGTAFASRTIRAITFSADGTMYIGTDSSDPILIVNPVTRSVDYFYKNILPPYCKNFYWGRGTYLYLLSGNSNPAQEWNIYRVDIGTAGAPYY